MDAFTLDQIQIFLTVVDEGSFTEAAKKLNRARSAVTYGIQKLETQIGQSLFDIGPSITQPSLLMWGDQDHGAAMGKGVARLHDLIPGNELVVFPGLRHSLESEIPVELATHVVATFDARCLTRRTLRTASPLIQVTKSPPSCTSLHWPLQVSSTRRPGGLQRASAIGAKAIWGQGTETPQELAYR